MVAGTAGTAAEPKVWDTREVRDAEAFAYYRDGICEAFMTLVPEQDRPQDRPFRARLEHRPLAGGAALNRVRASAHLVRRTRAEIAAAPDACFYLNLETLGECRIAQAGQTVTLRAGDVGLFSSDAPFDLAHGRPELGVASFWIPRAALQDRLRDGLADRPHLVSAHPVLGPLLRETALTLAEGAAHLDGAGRDRLFAMLLDLTAMALADPAGASTGAGAPGLRADGRRARRDALHLAICRHLDRHLGDPGLGLDRVAAAFALSRRSLQALFAERGSSFTAELQHRRLAAAAAALRAPASAHLPIAHIALAAGFADPAPFSRAFKARYGTTPGGWRRGEG